ncbi:MAG: hypothetical protein GY808_00135 [Gammaproteobacteria bacterium]|nr:hypothetical protein [Gammaproteobacteria bacterium]
MKQVIFLFLCALMISACGDRRNPKLEKYSDSWIENEVKNCAKLANPSRIKALACDNYKRECAARNLNC